jgi:hypothetical protein
MKNFPSVLKNRGKKRGKSRGEIYFALWYSVYAEGGEGKCSVTSKENILTVLPTGGT